MKKMKNKTIVFKTILLLTVTIVISCGGNNSNSNKESDASSNDSLIEVKEDKLSTACDCKDFALNNGIKWPESSDLLQVMDSTFIDESQIENYRVALARVNTIRSKYPTYFKEKCVDKFGENGILGAACTEKEIKEKLLNEAINFMKNRCYNVNQQLVKYQVTKINNSLLFMFMSVAPNGDVCISGISEYNTNEIISSDCGSAEAKSAEWDSVSEYKL